MFQPNRKLATQVQWTEPDGQRKTLEARGGEISIVVEHGAVWIEAKDCLMTHGEVPGKMPQYQVRVDEMSITLPLQSCSISGIHNPLVVEKPNIKKPANASFDVFISHASEDKDSVARPLYEALTQHGLTVWLDEAELTIGDSLRRKIDEGLSQCKFGIVVISPRFLAKEWPQRELDGLMARETTSGKKAILPVWHEIDAQSLAAYSPTLADRLSGNTNEGLATTVQKILRAVRK